LKNEPSSVRVFAFRYYSLSFLSWQQEFPPLLGVLSFCCLCTSWHQRLPLGASQCYYALAELYKCEEQLK
jgi:hypothetical protein